MLLTKLGTGQKWLKAGFLGFPKSGKTYTAIELAIGTRALLKHPGPIAMFDTEGGSEYVAERVREATGTDLLGYKGRAFADLMTLGRDCIESNVSILIVDSITHVWRELCNAYLQRINANRSPAARKSSMELLDWAKVKEQWSVWPDFYLNSALHIIVCGRAGFEWDMEKNEETNKRELVKTGVKMKTEAEFGFEPSLLVEMERVQDDSGKSRVMRHSATVLGDRFGVIDGKYIEFSATDEGKADPKTFEFFKPHVERLGGVSTPIDLATKTPMDVDASGDGEWAREKRTRAILCEEIQGELTAKWPGQTSDEKRSKTETIDKVFGTRSWTKVEGLQSETLRAGLARIREITGASVPSTNASFAASATSPVSATEPATKTGA